jgi:hypothetical protein
LAWISLSILTICKLIAPRSPTCPGTVATTGFGAATKALFCPQSLICVTAGGGSPTYAAMFPTSGTGWTPVAPAATAPTAGATPAATTGGTAAGGIAAGGTAGGG